MSTEKLDNPAWFSLNETHSQFAVDYNGICFYHPDYCPMGGFTVKEATEKGIDKYASLANDFYVIGEKPAFSEGIILKRELICYQLLLDNRISVEITEPITKIQTEEQKSDLFHLVLFVYPGLFKTKTTDLGNYYGIYKNHQLVAAAGERMKMDGYTEISAVVTHPDYAGRCYASQLIARVADGIIDEDRIPYLHVTNTNTGAERLYKKLGFKKRTRISFWHFVTEQEEE